MANEDTTYKAPDVFSYITTEEANWRTARVPLTNSKSWNMYEHIQRCTNVANGWFNRGANDGKRRYDDIVTPIIDVAFRTEGFDVKDIIPYVDDAQYFYLSFLVKKYHPQWARKNQLDTFIDDVVETSIIYDLVIVKNVNNSRPEVIDLSTIAFCDQTDALAGALCLKHNYTVGELLAYKGKWNDKEIDVAIAESKEEKKIGIANNQVVKTPGKYIEAYELRGNFPETWIDPEGDSSKYVPQMHVVCYYTNTTGDKQGLTLYSGLDKPLTDNFKALKIDRVRSKGRACGRSIVERLFEPQVWNNYSAQKIKDLLDSAINVIVTDSDELGNQKLSDLKQNTILKQEKGANTQRLDGTLQNFNAFQTDQVNQENRARTLGSASEASLGRNPVSGTPFALQNLIVQEGQGIHDYRQGKIATFFADVLYPDLILQYLVDEMNQGKKFSEEVSMDEIAEIAENVATKDANQSIIDAVLNSGRVPTQEEIDAIKQVKKDVITQGKTPMYSKGRGFFELLKDELKDIPVKVFVNIKGKQKRMVEEADKLTNIITFAIANAQAIQANPSIGKTINELLEDSGLSAIDFTHITKPSIIEPTQPQVTTQVA